MDEPKTVATATTDSTGTTPPTKEYQIPEWEEAAQKPTASRRSFHLPNLSLSASRKLDAIFPPHRKYFGRRRRTFLIFLVVLLLCLLALIIGLAVGLTSRDQNGKALALPSNRDTFTGDLTYYDTGLGACGWTNTNNQNIVAVSRLLFDAAGSSSQSGGNSNNNPLCGKMLRATRFDASIGQQRSVDLQVVDRCVGCKEHDIDVSDSAFDHLADMAQGRVSVQWAWL